MQLRTVTGDARQHPIALTCTVYVRFWNRIWSRVMSGPSRTGGFVGGSSAGATPWGRSGGTSEVGTSRRALKKELPGPAFRSSEGAFGPTAVGRDAMAVAVRLEHFAPAGSVTKAHAPVRSMLAL